MAADTRNLSEADLEEAEYRQLSEGLWSSKGSVSSNIFPHSIFNVASHAEIEMQRGPDQEDIVIHEYLENGDSTFKAVNENGEKLMEARVKDSEAINPEPLKEFLERHDLERLEYVANTDYDWRGISEEGLEDVHFSGRETEEILAGEIRDGEEVMYKLNADKTDDYSLQDLYKANLEASEASIKAGIEGLFFPANMAGIVAASLTSSMFPGRKGKNKTD
ncbi:MAG: hypothetical protein ACLFTA_02915 [Candidatus Nanohaloarchaea archaeon]